MIKILIFQIIFGVLFSLNALEWQDEYEDAHAKALKENKILYAFIVSNTCHWCKKMEETTMLDRSITERLEKDFVVVELIRGFDDYPKTLSAKMVPKHFFLTPDEKEILAFAGYWNVEDFASFLDEIVLKYKKIKGNK